FTLHERALGGGRVRASGSPHRVLKQRLFALAIATFASLPIEAAQRKRLPAPRAHASQYNVLVILLDDFGTDKMSFYRQGPTITGYPETPVLLGLRHNGIMFTNVYTNPTCGPSRAMIQTGRYGFRTTFGENIYVGAPPTNFQLSNSEVFLSELVQHAP